MVYQTIRTNSMNIENSDIVDGPLNLWGDQAKLATLCINHTTNPNTFSYTLFVLQFFLRTY